MPSKKEKNIVEGEIINAENNTSANEPTQDFSTALLDPKKNKNGIFIGTLNLVAAPAQAITKQLKHHYHHKYHKRYTHAKKLFILDSLLILTALGLLAITVFYFSYQSKQNALSISLEKSSTATIGEAREFSFLINNLKNNSLSDTELTFEFPKSFVLKTYPEKFNPQTNTLALGLLKEKAQIRLAFTGTLWGALNEQQHIAIKGRYINSKNNSWNEELSLLDLSLEKSILAVDWAIPSPVRVGQNFNITINYKNNSSEKINKAIIIPTLPADFEITSSNVDLVDNRLALADIPANKEGQILISGFLRSKPPEEAITISLKTYLEHQEQQYLQSGILKSLVVVSNDLDLKFKLTDQKTFIKPGETVALIINYKNNNQTEIKDLAIELPLPAFITETKSEKITINKKNQLALANINPNEEGLVNLAFKVAPNIGLNEQLEKNFSLTLRPRALFYLANEPQNLLRSYAVAQNFKLSTFLKLHGEARYFTEEGDQLGRGPLPPQVGQLTKYWINLFVTSLPNSIKDVNISGILPTGVTWTNHTNVSLGEPIHYDNITKSFSWKTDYIEATPQNQCPCAGISFEVAITPTADNIGKILTLVKDLKIIATDIYTNEYITKTTEDITTDLFNDSYAKNKGKVTN